MKLIKMMIVLILLVMAVQNVYGFGVSPARTVVDFEPGLSREVTLSILNSQNNDMDAIISAEGELSEYVIFDTNSVSFTSDESVKPFTFRVKLPQNIEKPGDNDVNIVITEVPKSTGKGATMIEARMSVVSQLRIKVPYPGTYAEGEFYVSALNEDVTITIPVTNFGTEKVIAKANIKIFDDGGELEEIDANSIEIVRGDVGKIISHWSAPSKGSYNALVEVDYGKVITLEKDFFVGDVLVNVDDVSLGEFELGDVVEVDIVLESEWNDIVEDVYADVVVKDKNGNEVNEFKTTSEDMGALSKGTLKGYWDTTGVSSDVYELVINLNYAGKTSEEIVSVDVEQELRSMPLEFLRLNISVVLIAISIVILLIVGLLLFIRKK
jgi:hypothetical protein